MLKNHVYSMSIYKLMKTKKYLEENLKKKFFNLNFIFFISSIFFATKFNEKFRFCVIYRKFNAIIKRNYYLISFIEETFVKIMSCKYIIKLNIIAVFNKLRIHLNNENLIIFIIFMKIYKYYLLSFDSTNEFVNYQHYMNDVFLNISTTLFKLISIMFLFIIRFCNDRLGDSCALIKFFEIHK